MFLYQKPPITLHQQYHSTEGNIFNDESTFVLLNYLKNKTANNFFVKLHVNTPWPIKSKLDTLCLNCT